MCYPRPSVPHPRLRPLLTALSPLALLRFTAAQGVPATFVKKRLFLGYNGEQPQPSKRHSSRPLLYVASQRCHSSAKTHTRPPPAALGLSVRPLSLTPVPAPSFFPTRAQAPSQSAFSQLPHGSRTNLILPPPPILCSLTILLPLPPLGHRLNRPSPDCHLLQRPHLFCPAHTPLILLCPPHPPFPPSSFPNQFSFAPPPSAQAPSRLAFSRLPRSAAATPTSCSACRSDAGCCPTPSIPPSSTREQSVRYSHRPPSPFPLVCRFQLPIQCSPTAARLSTPSYPSTHFSTRLAIGHTLCLPPPGLLATPPATEKFSMPPPLAPRPTSRRPFRQDARLSTPCHAATRLSARHTPLVHTRGHATLPPTLPLAPRCRQDAPASGGCAVARRACLL
jgi:hypothetical protein